jgi:hypothetical protein
MLDTVRKTPSSNRTGETAEEESIIREIMQVKLRENPELNPQHQSREKGEDRNTDVLSLSFTAGVKVPIWI